MWVSVDNVNTVRMIYCSAAAHLRVEVRPPAASTASSHDGGRRHAASFADGQDGRRRVGRPQRGWSRWICHALHAQGIDDCEGLA